MTYRPRGNSQNTIWTFSPEGFWDVAAGVSGTFSTGVWPTASRAMFFPFEIATPRTATQMMWYNGTTASGNVDAGIYDTSGNRLRSTGSTAQTGTSVLQVANITDILLATGTYLMALSLDNNTGGFVRSTVAHLVQLELGGMRQMASAFPLPDPVTLVIPTSSYIPAFGITLELTTV